MPGPIKRLVRLARVGALVWAMSLACAGCSSGKGDVTGKVTRNKKTVVFGTVLIVGIDRLPHMGPILEDGSYVVKDVPVGPVRMAVNSPDPTTPLFNKDDEKKGRSRPPEEEKRLAALKTKWAPLPRTYGDVTTADLTLEVHSGNNSHDIDLK